MLLDSSFSSACIFLVNTINYLMIDIANVNQTESPGDTMVRRTTVLATHAMLLSKNYWKCQD